MLLRDSWVDEIWGRLALAYGTAFQRQYADLDQAAVKRDWSEVLGIFDSHPKAVAQALASLPADKPPNARQFKALGMSALAEQRQEVQQLPAPKADPAMVAAVLAAIKPATPTGSLAQQCMDRIVGIHGPNPSNPAVRDTLAACRAHNGGAAELAGLQRGGRMIQPDELPETMRAAA